MIRETVRAIRVNARRYMDSKVRNDFSHGVHVSEEGVLIDLKMPASYESIRIDIGLSHNAPNSALWTKTSPSTFVIGVEANRFNVARLLRWGTWSRNDPKNPVRRHKPRNLQILFCALDDVASPCFSDFYHMGGDPGTSSLLKPTNVLSDDFGYSLQVVSKVPTLRLSSLMALLPWDRIPTVEVCKIDTQGKDLAILKSADEFLQRILVLEIEMDTYGQYESAPSREEIIQFLDSAGFEPLVLHDENHEPLTDVIFLNRAFENEALKIAQSLR